MRFSTGKGTPSQNATQNAYRAEFGVIFLICFNKTSKKKLQILLPSAHLLFMKPTLKIENEAHSKMTNLILFVCIYIGLYVSF